MIKFLSVNSQSGCHYLVALLPALPSFRGPGWHRNLMSGLRLWLGWSVTIISLLRLGGWASPVRMIRRLSNRRLWTMPRCSAIVIFIFITNISTTREDQEYTSCLKQYFVHEDFIIIFYLLMRLSPFFHWFC